MYSSLTPAFDTPVSDISIVTSPQILSMQEAQEALQVKTLHVCSERSQKSAVIRALGEMMVWPEKKSGKWRFAIQILDKLRQGFFHSIKDEKIIKFLNTLLSASFEKPIIYSTETLHQRNTEEDNEKILEFFKLQPHFSRPYLKLTFAQQQDILSKTYLSWPLQQHSSPTINRKILRAIIEGMDSENLGDALLEAEVKNFCCLLSNTALAKFYGDVPMFAKTSIRTMLRYFQQLLKVAVPTSGDEKIPDFPLTLRSKFTLLQEYRRGDQALFLSMHYFATQGDMDSPATLDDLHILYMSLDYMLTPTSFGPLFAVGDQTSSDLGDVEQRKPTYENTQEAVFYRIFASMINTEGSEESFQIARLLYILIEYTAKSKRTDCFAQQLVEIHKMRESGEYSVHYLSTHFLLLNGDLAQAIQKKQIGKIHALIQKGANVNTQDKQGNTALMVAVEGAQIQLATLLITLGSRIDIKNKSNATALDIARALPNETLIDLLVEADRAATGEDASNFIYKI